MLIDICRRRPPADLDDKYRLASVQLGLSYISTSMYSSPATKLPRGPELQCRQGRKLLIVYHISIGGSHARLVQPSKKRSLGAVVDNEHVQILLRNEIASVQVALSAENSVNS